MRNKSDNTRSEQNSYILNHRKNLFIVLILAIIVIAIAFFAVSSCSGKSNKTSETTFETEASTTTVEATTTASTTTEPQPTPEPEGPANRFTGLPLEDEAIKDDRPVALMINNVKVANPHIGVGQADLVFEMEVEGGLTRMMAYYASASLVPETGSIRSCRHDFIDLAGGFDAVPVHVGGSYAANNQFAAQDSEHLDAGVLPNTFWRDQDWKVNRGYEHSVRTEGSRLLEAMTNMNIRMEIKEDYAKPFEFSDSYDVTAAGDIAAAEVVIPLTRSSRTTVTYDETEQAYTKTQHGAVQADFKDGKPYLFTNVLILQAPVTSYTGSDILREIDLTGGNGYYISGGQATKIKWQKGATYDRFQFTQEDGSSIEFNKGKFYIAVIYTGGTPEFSAELN